VCSGVGYGKMDYPTQHAIYHCQSKREGKSQRREDRNEWKMKAWGDWGKDK